MVVPGKYIARGESITFGELENEKQTPFAEGTFVITGGEFEGETLRRKFWLTDKAEEYSARDLKTAGCTFPDGDIFDTTGFGDSSVQLVVVENDGGYIDIKYINRVGGPGGGSDLKADTKEKIRTRMRAKLRAAGAGAGAGTGGEVDDGSDIPF